jgi:hypothetical protein
MKMYVANLTKQVQSFCYRLPEGRSPRQQEIAIGGQTLLSGDLTKMEVDSIIEQHAKYGLVDVAEIDRTKPFAGLCYSIDKPISVEKIRRGLAHNDDVLVDRGRQTQKEAALAVARQVNETNPNALTALEMDVSLDKKGDSEDTFGDQKVRVDTNAPSSEITDEKSARQAARERRKASK